MRPDQELNSGETFNVPEGLCRQFSIAEILAATNEFSDSLVIGQGGFAKVYKGEIDNGSRTVAIKKSKSMSPELRKEFRDEILMVSRFRHSHLVSLIGYCETDNEMILVYEYMAGGTLDDNLHKIGIDVNNNYNNNVPLCWVERLKICIGAARALDYLHTGTGINNKVIHRDVKSSNILLDATRATAKISDFGMSKISPANQLDTRVITRVVGTFGYLDPDYYSTGILTSKSDVYAFGVVLFELLCGRLAVDSTLDEDQRSLAGWARLCVKKGKVEQIIDPNLKSEILPRSLSAYVKVANSCLNGRPKERPTMTEVLAELVLALSLQQSGKRNRKKSDNAFHVGGSKIAEKFRLRLSVKPRPISGNSAEFDATETEPTPNDNETTPNDNETTQNDNATTPNDVQAVNIEPVVVTSVRLAELKEITENFSKKAFIGGGPCGNSYYGILKSGQASCIKKFELNEFPEQFFLTKVSLLSKLKHENVVALLHYCVDGLFPILAYEYAPNGSLHEILHGQKGTKDAHLSRVLSWSERLKIAIGAAKGLQYLHEKAQPNIIHRSIKSRNILLFNDGVAKIADIKILDDAPDKQWQSPPRFITCYTKVVDYDAPEYTTYRVFSSKIDVYSFGVVLLELLTGREVVDYTLPHSEHNLVKWATPKLSEDKVKQCIDPRLEGKYPHIQAAKMAAIASSCLQYEAEFRPSMSMVVEDLQTLVKFKPGPSRVAPQRL